MKLQDILFIVVVIILLLLRKPKFFVVAGIFCLVVSIPLFSKWLFFTTERLTWYAAVLFFLAIIVFIFQLRDNKKK